MNSSTYWLYLAILAGSTYLIRVLPFVAIRKKINNRFIQSFLYYIPYAVLTAMTLPGIFYTTDYMASALVGLVVAVIFALKNKGLTTVAVASCLAVYLSEILINL